MLVLKELQGRFKKRSVSQLRLLLTPNACWTTCDAFLRDNLDWLAKATNWAKSLQLQV